MRQPTSIDRLAGLLKKCDYRVLIGLEQGHIPTVERMLAEGKSWDEIGDAIGWDGPAAEEWYGYYLTAKGGRHELSLSPDQRPIERAQEKGHAE